MSENKKIVKQYHQNFRQKWLTDPFLRDWLVEVPKKNGGSGVECRYCKSYLNMKYCDLKNHAGTKKHKKNVEKNPGLKHQLMLKVDADNLNGVDGSEGDVSAQPCGFVINQSDLLPRQVSSNQSVKPSFPSNLTASGGYDFDDLIRFDLNGDADTSNSTRTQIRKPWPYLEENYFVYTGSIDGTSKVTFKCKLCLPNKTVRVTKNSLHNLKYHIRTNHWSYWDEFLKCIKDNARPGRKKKPTRPWFTNPWPYLEEKYYEFNGSVDANKMEVMCKLCSPMKPLKAVRTNIFSLEQHIRKMHHSHWEDFQSLTKANSKFGRRKNSDENEDSDVLDQSITTPEKQQSDDVFVKSEKPRTRCKKIALPPDLIDSDDEDGLEDLYDDDDDPDFTPLPHDREESPEPMDDEHEPGTTFRKTLVPKTELTVKKRYIKPAFVPSFVQASKGTELSRFVPLFDRVLVQREEKYTQILTKDGYLIAPRMNTARVVAVGTGIRSDCGEMIPLEVSIGDQVMIPEYGGFKVDLDGKEYLLFNDSDLLAKLKPK